MAGKLTINQLKENERERKKNAHNIHTWTHTKIKKDIITCEIYVKRPQSQEEEELSETKKKIMLLTV